jgi:DNA-binding transcriptional MerR regulator
LGGSGAVSSGETALRGAKAAGKMRGMSFTEIKEQVTQLSAEQRAELRELIEELEADAWDEQIKEDARAGRLDHLIAKVDADIAAGRTVRLP